MSRDLESIANLDQAIERAREMATAKQTTIFVNGSRTRGYVVCNEPDGDEGRAAKVTRTGLVLYWAPSLEGYVSIPDD